VHRHSNTAPNPWRPTPRRRDHPNPRHKQIITGRSTHKNTRTTAQTMRERERETERVAATGDEAINAA
jgi:hypothetical protein